MLSGLLGAFTALLGALLVPLALGSATAWLLIPAHLGFSVACATGAIVAGVGGRPWRARVYGMGHLAGSLGAVLALAAGAEARDGSWYWILPWAVCLLWAWIPPIIALLAAWLGEVRRSARTGGVVRRRRAAIAISAEDPRPVQ